MKEKLDKVIAYIVSDPSIHARFLNTLSLMEHTGASRIAQTQYGSKATFMVLKHTSEEARHAFFLKKLSYKVSEGECPDYQPAHLLAATVSRQYLLRLDLAISRLLRNSGYSGQALHDLAYLLVTYAIEVRADDIYPIYQERLKDLPVKISVQSIINEEEGHLEEMNRALAEYPEGIEILKETAIGIETTLFNEWVNELEKELKIQHTELPV